MSFFEALFSGAKALFQGVVAGVREVVRVVLAEVDNSLLGRAATDMINGATKNQFNRARDYAEEEREYAQKRQRDGGLTESDQDRLREIESERDALRREIEAMKAAKNANEMKVAEDQVIAANFTPDEAAAAVGIMASKECPNCGGMMRIMQGAYNTRREGQNFFWKCTVPNTIPCPTLKLDPEVDRASVVRPPDPDLDGAHAERRAIWTREDVLAKTHGRLRQGLGEDDEEVICPTHLLPMKLMPLPHGGGRLLDNYHYVCLAVHANGRACEHTVAVKSFPQVAATLKRRDGVGIIT